MLSCYYMNHIEFRKYLEDQAERHPVYKLITRLYKNAYGADLMVHLPQQVWDNADWLETRGDIDIGAWVIHCDQTPFDDWTVSQLMLYWLWLDECRRHRYGDPTPTNMRPEGYESYGERSND